MADRLPGFEPIGRHRYRNERGIDGVAKWLRELHQYGPHEHAVVTLARTVAASLDRLEHDPDRSEHTVGNVGRVMLLCLQELRPRLVAGGDSFDELLGELSTALRDPPAI